MPTAFAAGTANRPHQPGWMAPVAEVRVEPTRLYAPTDVRVRTRDVPRRTPRSAHVKVHATIYYGTSHVEGSGVGRARTPSNVNPCAGARSVRLALKREAKIEELTDLGGPGCPPFDDISPLFQSGRARYGLTARTADRAVPVRLRRFLAVNHVICTSPYKQEVAGSYPAAPIGHRGIGSPLPHRA